MKQLNFDLKQLCKRNSDGGFNTQYDRERILSLVANELDDLGYKNLTSHGLKPKHITSLIEKWSNKNLSAGTIKNRMSALRWWAEKINKPSIIAKDNDHYCIDQRIFL